MLNTTRSGLLGSPRRLLLPAMAGAGLLAVAAISVSASGASPLAGAITASATKTCPAHHTTACPAARPVTGLPNIHIVKPAPLGPMPTLSKPVLSPLTADQQARLSQLRTEYNLAFPRTVTSVVPVPKAPAADK